MLVAAGPPRTRVAGFPAGNAYRSDCIYTAERPGISQPSPDGLAARNSDTARSLAPSCPRRDGKCALRGRAGRASDRASVTRENALHDHPHQSTESIFHSSKYTLQSLERSEDSWGRLRSGGVDTLRGKGRRERLFSSES